VVQVVAGGLGRQPRQERFDRVFDSADERHVDTAAPPDLLAAYTDAAGSIDGRASST
jgi:hypothetical protein